MHLGLSTQEVKKIENKVKKNYNNNKMYQKKLLGMVIFLFLE